MPTLEAVLARRLRAVAEEKGIPISHLADHAGIARSHVWALLKEERSATLGLVQRLAEVLGVDARPSDGGGRAGEAGEEGVGARARLGARGRA